VISKQFDFHLQYFSVGDGIREDNIPRLDVYPFSEFESEPGESQHYNTTGKYGRYWCDQNKESAVRKREDGLELYASSGINIYPYLQHLLLESHAVFVHAAGVVDGAGEVTLLPGSGGVGKTALLGELVTRHGIQVLGDDVICVTDNAEAYSFPRSFVFKKYHREVYPEVFSEYNLKHKHRKDKITTKTIKFALRNAPFMGIIKDILHRTGYYNRTASAISKARGGNYLATIPAEEIFGSDAIATSGRLKQAVFLRRADQPNFSLESISKDRLTDRLFSIILREWQGEISVLFDLGSLELLNLESYFHQMSTIIAEAIDDVPCYEFIIPSDAPPESLTNQFLSRVELQTMGTSSENK
jgi:hypothetical protein